jgi:dTDP-4-amino-4,6-dideoxygalactose transaminase
MQIDEKKCGISRDDFLTEMTKRKIGVGVHYLAIPEHPFYQNTYNWRPEDYPHAAKFGQQTVSIPLTAKLTDGELERIIKAVKEVINGK